MTKAVIEAVINEFLDSDTPEVLAVSGQWGTGKTYALQRMVRAHSGANSLLRYSYVSAFGAKSIGDLRSMILIKSRPFPVQERLEHAAEGASAVFAKGRGLALYKAARTWFEQLPNGGKHVTVLLETLATSLITRTIVCIDDVERLGSGIQMEELMGLVSELKVESQCKIILLFNEEQLGKSAEQYALASEKVVDKKLSFVTTASEAVEIGLPADTPLRHFVVPCIETLDISNIRTIQKIAKGLTMVHDVIPNCSDVVKQQAAIAVAVFAGALYEAGNRFPTPEQVRAHNWYSAAGNDDHGDVGNEWREKLRACGFLICDEFDAEVLSVMRNGYPQGAALLERAVALDAVADRSRLDGLFTAVWKKFHNYVDGSAEELVREFVEVVRVAATAITPLNLNSTVKLARDLGFDVEADAMIESYIQVNAGNTELFRIDDSPWRRDVDDETLLRRFAEVLSRAEGQISLEVAVHHLLEQKSWDDRTLAALLAASSNDYEAMFKTHQGEEFWQLLDRLQTFAHSRGMEAKPIVENVIAALKTLASQSDLNRLRSKRWSSKFSLTDETST